jgi:hypothetical protein
MKARESFDLHAEVQRDKIKSTFKDGVLEIRMPESPEAISGGVKIKGRPAPTVASGRTVGSDIAEAHGRFR